METSRPFRHILVGVDAGGQAAGAVARAFDFAKRFGSKLELVHAVEDMRFAKSRSEAFVHARKHTLEALRTSPATEGVDISSISADLSVREGHPAKLLLEMAADNYADLIVLGPHSKRSPFDFGSTARAVLCHTETPVCVQQGSVQAIESLLVPVDFSPESERALDCAQTLAHELGASLRVMHCHTPPSFAYVSADGVPGPTYVVDDERRRAREELEALMARRDWGDVAASSAFVEGEPADRILEAATTADMVVMGTHGRTGLTRFLLGSVAYAVLKGAEQPVLVVPSPKPSWLLPQGEQVFDADADPSTSPRRPVPGHAT